MRLRLSEVQAGKVDVGTARSTRPASHKLFSPQEKAAAAWPLVLGQRVLLACFLVDEVPDSCSVRHRRLQHKFTHQEAHHVNWSLSERTSEFGFTALGLLHCSLGFAREGVTVIGIILGIPSLIPYEAPDRLSKLRLRLWRGYKSEQVCGSRAGATHFVAKRACTARQCLDGFNCTGSNLEIV